MIASDQIAEIIALYKKHGWILRRVLLSDALQTNLGNAAEKLFADAEIATSDIDALWFSRSSRPAQETWELRHLSLQPFALVEVFNTHDDHETRQAVCERLVEKLKNSRN